MLAGCVEPGLSVLYLQRIDGEYVMPRGVEFRVYPLVN